MMTMSNSPLISYTRLSPNCGNGDGYPLRTHPISKITIHHVAGVTSVETLGEIFAPVARQASSNYGIGIDGRIGLYVPESTRAWTSSSAWNDNRAVTIEVSNSAIGDPWPVSDLCLERTIELCVDICKRNDIPELVFTGNKTGSLTLHKMFGATTCPEEYLSSKIPYIAQEVTRRLKSGSVAKPEEPKTLYRIQVGAFSKIENAEAYQKQVSAALKAAGINVQPFITVVRK